jgi:hypothetical protein
MKDKMFEVCLFCVAGNICKGKIVGKMGVVLTDEIRFISDSFLFRLVASAAAKDLHEGRYHLNVSFSTQKLLSTNKTAVKAFSYSRKNLKHKHSNTQRFFNFKFINSSH